MQDTATLLTLITKRQSRQRPLLNLDTLNAALPAGLLPDGRQEKPSATKPMLAPKPEWAGREEELALKLLVLERKDLTIGQMARQLYGTNTKTSRAALRQLKLRAEGKMLNQLYFLDHSDERFVVSRRYEAELLDLLHKASILHLEGEYDYSVRILEKCLREAKKGDFTNYAEQAAGRLLVMYADKGLAAKFEQIQLELQRLRQVLAWEQEAELLCSSARLATDGKLTVKRLFLHEQGAQTLDRLRELHESAKTFNTYNAWATVRLTVAELNGRYDDIIAQVTEAQAQLAAGQLNARRFDVRRSHFMNVYAHLRSRQVQEGLRLAEASSSLFHPTSSNWLYFWQHYVLLALHAGEYARAYDMVQQAQQNPSYSRQRGKRLEYWELLDSYASLVQEPGRVEAKRLRDLARFALNTIPEYSQDKLGNNVAILIFQFLHHLQERLLDQVLARLERLRKYQQRHLRDAGTLRSRKFVRLLLLLTEADFNPDDVEWRSQRLLRELREAPVSGEADAELEIIPYEALWEFTLATLRAGRPE